MCHMLHVTFFLFFFFGQSGEAYRWLVCYQRGLPCLVFYLFFFLRFGNIVCMSNTLVSRSNIECSPPGILPRSRPSLTWSPDLRLFPPQGRIGAMMALLSPAPPHLLAPNSGPHSRALCRGRGQILHCTYCTGFGRLSCSVLHCTKYTALCCGNHWVQLPIRVSPAAEDITLWPGEAEHYFTIALN